jgi:hypothetical protein
VTNSGYLILRFMPNMEIPGCSLLNDRSSGRWEAFSPEEYRLARTNKVENGRRVRTLRPHAMITGYGFLRFAGGWDVDDLNEVRHVLRDKGDFWTRYRKPMGLTVAEVDRLRSVHAEELAKYQRQVARREAEDAAKIAGKPTVAFERGKQVLVDSPTGEPWIATMLQERGSRRVAVMLENARVMILEHSRVHEVEVAA